MFIETCDWNFQLEVFPEETIDCSFYFKGWFMKKSLFILFGCILICAGPIIFVSGVIYTLLLPNIYASNARIAVTATAQPELGAQYNPYFIRTQFELLQSKPILNELARRLDLQTVWGRDGNALPAEVTFRILRNSISVFQQRDTPLIVLLVRRDNPEEAANIANTWAEVYRDYRLLQAEKNTTLTLGRLEQAIAGQQKRLKAADQLNEQKKSNESAMELASEQSVYNELKLRHRQALITAQVPNDPMQVVDPAEVNPRPVSPNLFMNTLLSLFIGGVVLIFGIILFIIGVIIKRRKQPKIRKPAEQPADTEQW